MRETQALLERATRYLKSAALLLNNGDYKYTFIISQEEAEQGLTSGRKFVAQIVKHLSDQAD
jgi:HEPN domain-containing protein